MTSEEPTGVEPSTLESRREPSPRQRQVIEIIVWVISPIVLLVGASLIALILGAPWFRCAVVFALLAIGAGAFSFYKPQRWFSLGPWRFGGLIYCGIGAFILALGINAPPSEQAPRPVRGQDEAVSTPAPAPAPTRRSIYPWAYSVSPLTLTCENSSAVGVGDVTASAEDGRVFAVSEGAQSADRLSISTIEKTTGDRTIVREAAADLADAGQALCRGPERPAHTLIASEGAPPPPPPPPPSPWSYRNNVDEMSDQRISHACTLSTNFVQLGFPYETQRVSLCLRQHPRWGQDVIVRLERGGQFLCTSYNGCTVRVRFGDGEAVAYSARAPSDNSTDTLFISNDARFIGNLRRASQVIIEANFYQAGAQRMSFQTGQLEWPPRPQTVSAEACRCATIVSVSRTSPIVSHVGYSVRGFLRNAPPT